MWIILRLAALCLGFMVRFFAQVKKNVPDQTANGHFYWESYKQHKGKITHVIGVPLELPISFVLTPETLSDRFFKGLGMSSEFQTGDSAFDSAVYIACDHPFFAGALKRSADARALILNYFSKGSPGIKRLWSDGRMLYIKANFEMDRATNVKQLHTVSSALKSAMAQIPTRFSDSFTWRVLVVESFVYSIAGYALVASVDYIFNSYDSHVSQMKIISLGLLLSLAVLAGLMALIVFFLKRSSRSHRILIESAVILIFSLPVFGAQAISDLNRSMDTSTLEIQTRVTKLWQQKHRKRHRRSTIHSYYMNIEPKQGLQEKIKIPVDLFSTLREGQEIRIVLGRGRLGILWYRSIADVSYE